MRIKSASLECCSRLHVEIETFIVHGNVSCIRENKKERNAYVERKKGGEKIDCSRRAAVYTNMWAQGCWGVVPWPVLGQVTGTPGMPDVYFFHIAWWRSDKTKAVYNCDFIAWRAG